MSTKYAALKTFVWAGALLLLFILVCPGWSAIAQAAKKKASPARPSLDLLLTRVESYWDLLLQRKRAKAADYVDASERQDFLDRSTPKFTDPRLKSLEPSADRLEAKVTVSVKRTTSFGPMDWPVSERWVFKNGNWFLHPDPQIMPVSGLELRESKAQQVEAQKSELRKLIRFDQSTLDFGIVQRGTPVNLTLKYSLDGDADIHVIVEKSIPELAVKGLVQGVLVPGKGRELTIEMPTNNFEGTVVESIQLTARLKDIEVPFKIAIQGFVYVPVSVIPKILRLNPANETREKEILVRNFSKSLLEIQSFSSQSGTVEVGQLPASVPPGRQIALKVKQIRDAERPDMPDTLTLVFANPIEDTSSVAISLVLNARERQDGTVYDPSMDPALQKLLHKNLTIPPKR